VHWLAVWQPKKEKPVKVTKTPAKARKIEIPPLTKEKSTGTKGDAEARLRQLKRLYEQGLIEKGEYDEKRKRILDEL